jgi:hypothetical protein
MLVYPEQEDVELYYGHTMSDNIGRLISFSALILIGLMIFRNGRKDRHIDNE